MTNKTDPRVTEIRAILDTVDVDDGGWVPPGEPGDWYPFSPNVSDAEKDRITRDIIAALDAARPVEPPGKAKAAIIERQQAEIARLTAERDEWEETAQENLEHAERAGDAYLEFKTRATAAEAEVTDLRASLAKAGEALEPFAGAVFYDNGDLTVTTFQATYADYKAAYFARQKARTALDAIKEDRT